MRSRHGTAEPGSQAPGRVGLRVDAPLTVRGPRPGDRLRTAAGHVPVGRLLARHGVPSGLRGNVPVVIAGGRVVWVAGHAAAVDALAPPGSPCVVLEVD